MATMHENSAWVVNEAARRLHEEGLRQELDERDFVTAHRSFARAEAILTTSISDDDQLQRARIVRDDGFTTVREAVTAANPLEKNLLFDTAEFRLYAAAGVTTELLERLIPAGEPQSRRQRELYSEHGATLSTLARMAVARQTVLQELPYTKQSYTSRQELRRHQRHFGRAEAHDHLRQGTNMYYLVSNAMHGARAEFLNGRLAHIVPWLGRAAVGLARADGKRKTARALVGGAVQGAETALQERNFSASRFLGVVTSAMNKTEFGTAFLTAGRIFWSMRSKRTAVASVIDRQ